MQRKFLGVPSTFGRHCILLQEWAKYRKAVTLVTLELETIFFSINFSVKNRHLFHQRN